MIRRLLTVSSLLTALVLATFASSAVALAAPYPPATPGVLTASAYDPCAGASNVIGGSAFAPGETVVVTLAKTGEIGRTVAGADGSWQITVTIPLSERGSDQVTATGLVSGSTAMTTLTFPCVMDGADAASAAGGADGAGTAGTQTSGTRTVGSGTLAYTGAVVGGALLAGMALLVGGVALVVAGRRRRSSVTD